MKKLMVMAAILLLASRGSAFAQKHDNHALGDLYTKALNALEAASMLDRLDQKTHVPIESIHMDQGQVIVTIKTDTGPDTIIYEPMLNKILH